MFSVRRCDGRLFQAAGADAKTAMTISLNIGPILDQITVMCRAREARYAHQQMLLEGTHHGSKQDIVQRMQLNIIITIL